MWRQLILQPNMCGFRSLLLEAGSEGHRELTGPSLLAFSASQISPLNTSHARPWVFFKGMPKPSDNPDDDLAVQQTNDDAQTSKLCALQLG